MPDPPLTFARGTRVVSSEQLIDSAVQVLVSAWLNRKQAEREAVEIQAAQHEVRSVLNELVPNAPWE